MGLKDYLKKQWDDFKEANKPENVKARLQTQIEIERLRLEKQKIMEEKRRTLEKNLPRFALGGKL